MESADELAGLASEMVMLLRRSWGTDQPINLLRVAATQLVDGDPISVSRIAAAIGAPAVGVRQVLRHVPDATWTADGRLTGLVVTATPTPYQLSIAHRRLYAASAFDAILVSVLLAQQINLVTSCHVTGTPIRVTVSPDGSAHAVPATAMVAVLACPERFTKLHTPLCPYQVVFRSPGVATGWLRAHANHRNLTVSDASRYAGRLTVTTVCGSRSLKS